MGHPNMPWTPSQKHSRAEHCIAKDLFSTTYVLDHRGNHFRKGFWVFSMYRFRAFFDSKVISHCLKSPINHSKEDGKGTEKKHFGCIFSMEPYTAKHKLCACSWNVLTCWHKERPNFWFEWGKGGLWNKLQDFSKVCLRLGKGKGGDRERKTKDDSRGRWKYLTCQMTWQKRDFRWLNGVWLLKMPVDTEVAWHIAKVNSQTPWGQV